MLWSDYYGAIPFDRELDVIGAARFVEEVYDNADAFGRRIKLLLVENLLHPKPHHQQPRRREPHRPWFYRLHHQYYF